MVSKNDANSQLTGIGLAMKQSKDPFEMAFEEHDESPPNSPPATTGNEQDDADYPDMNNNNNQSNADADGDGDAGTVSFSKRNVSAAAGKSNKEDDDDEEEENMEAELEKFPTTGDPDKMAKMQAILSQFTEEQMSRYESFRRSGFQRTNMKRLLASITGSQKVSIPMTIVVSGIAKMFVGEIVETARMVMTERKESGPIRPCHIREAFRRLKLEGKVPKRSVPRLFR